MWYPGSGVVLDCVVSRSLPPFLLYVVFLNHSNNKVTFYMCVVLKPCLDGAWVFSQSMFTIVVFKKL